MAYTAPRVWVAGETVDEDMMNEQVSANITYLKTEADKHDDCVMRDGSTVAYASPTGTRVKSTVYQNTSGKTRYVNLVSHGHAASDELDVTVGVANPPTIVVGGFSVVTANECHTISFTVPKNYYYKANEATAEITIDYWVEWDIL